MGTLMYVHKTIFIEENARVAQIYFHECRQSVVMYTGQFQGDKQRTQQ
jgi:deoxycytidine triphosphate deaminase